MRGIALTSSLLLASSGCAQILDLSDVAVDHRVGGRVHGLWDGSDGLTLWLQADGIDRLLTIASSGDFRFGDLLAPGSSYKVRVLGNPVNHACVVEAGDNGVIADADVANVSVACTGPAVTVALSGRWSSTFDSTREVQTLGASILMQSVALTINGASLTGATVNGTAATLGTPMAPIVLPAGSTTVPVAVTAVGGLSKTYQLVLERGKPVLDQLAYGKASNTRSSDSFGYAIALSGDTLAVAAPWEGSSATGINGNQADNNGDNSGAVYVFVRTGTTWTQQAYIKASNTQSLDNFGTALALYGDTLAVSAPYEASAATGINGNQADDSAPAAGAVYMFVRSGTTWTQQAYIKASNTGAFDGFGFSLALSGDTLAVGAHGEDSAATTINGNQTDNSATDAGAVYVFVRSGTTWTQQAYIKASSSTPYFGGSVALSADTLAVASLYGTEVHVFVRSGTTWTQQAHLKASNSGAGDRFGYSIALSGNTLAVGAPNEDSAATGAGGNQADDSATDAGAVYVFLRTGTAWSQQAYLKASNTGPTDSFGRAVALSGDTLVVGAPYEDSAASGLNGDQVSNAAYDTGAAYVFVRADATWTQHAYVKASNAGTKHEFGGSVALSGDTLVVGAPHETSAATGFNGNQTDNTLYDAGAVYLFR